MENTIIQIILDIIIDISNNIKFKGYMYNERYLHHFFSHKIQKIFNSLDISNEKTILFHPEWPTYKKTTNIKYGRYKKTGNIFMPNNSGTAGFIDFAIGDYNRPEIAIEFSLKFSWSNEEVIYDYIKLLDNINPFLFSISLNLIFRKNGLVKGGYLTDLKNHMQKAYIEATKRLNENVNKKRKIFFIISEISFDNIRRHWYFQQENSVFVEGLPIIKIETLE